MNLDRQDDTDPTDDEAPWLSALMDGEVQDGDTLRVSLRELHADPAARATWATYHLIGDVLRSADLARPTSPTLALGVRRALAREPVVLAPVPRVPVPRWRAPAAAVAGVALVAGTWVLLGPRGPAGQAPTLAAVSPAVSVPAPEPARPTLVRDAQLDRYLAAHREFAGATAIGGSTGLLRASVREAHAR